ncbi:MAG: hypothetical protein ACC653_12085 [Gammaproteobacteria bacterium]
MNIKCYSQRLLNPFRGMLNTIEYNSAEAVTMDGVYWDIYVRNSALVKDLEQEQINQHRIQTSEIRYGRWSKNTGLQRGPTIDSDDFKEMAATGEIVYQYLLQHHDEIPFAFKDFYELWLLDENNKPLTLLNSAVYKEDMDFEQNINWTPGIACKESFHSDHSNTSTSETRLNAGERLSRLINLHSNDSAQWIARNKNGTGQGLDGINLETQLVGRKIPAAQIPLMLINAKTFTLSEQKFIEDYYSWLAPWLLVLQSLSDDQRTAIEQQARSNASVIEKHYLLYPKIIDNQFIKSALVETMLRNNTTEITPEKVESVEYLELNNPTHHLNK